jgi:hypothetical protein
MTEALFIKVYACEIYFNFLIDSQQDYDEVDDLITQYLLFDRKNSNSIYPSNENFSRFNELYKENKLANK